MAVTTYTLYNATTGAIVGVVSCQPAELAGNIAANTPGASSIEGRYDPETQYIDVSLTPDAVAAKPALTTVVEWDVTTIAGDGNEDATLSDLPNPTYVRVTFDPVLGITAPDEVTVTDGTFVFSTDTPGVYTVTARAFPYLTLVTEVTAT